MIVELIVKGMHLVRELETDLKVANVICRNGRRHLTSSKNEVSRDLLVTRSSKRKQALLDMLPILMELCRAVDMKVSLEHLVTDGNFSKAFQQLSEYLQILDSLSELSAVQDMSRGVEVWLGKTLQKLDALLLEVCQDFKAHAYITVVDAYALVGDVAGLAEKIQSFFMQEVLSESHSALKAIVLEDLENPDVQSSRLTYSDLCTKIPESKFRQCLLATLAVIFQLMCSYHTIMSFQPEDKEVGDFLFASADGVPSASSVEQSPATTSGSLSNDVDNSVNETRDNGDAASCSESPWLQLRKDATTFVSHALQRGRKNLWQLTTSRVAVLLSSAAVGSTSIHQFLRNYEDLNIFILSGESFCGFEVTEFRQKVKSICESYFIAFHRQSIHALKMVTEKENWLVMPPEIIQVVSFAGLVGDGAALIDGPGRNPQSQLSNTSKAIDAVGTGSRRSGFSQWLRTGNPFLHKLHSGSKEASESLSNGSEMAAEIGKRRDNQMLSDGNHNNGRASVSEDENEDLLADFIDEDSQLPSRISKPNHPRERSTNWNDAEMRTQTGSSITLLKLMDKYARLMQKLEIVNVEFFRGICQLFGIFFHFIFETFGLPNEKGSTELLSYRLRTALSRVAQDSAQWIKPQTESLSSSSPAPLHATVTYKDVTPTSPPSHSPRASLGLKERCVGTDTISLVAQLLHRSKAHLQSMLLQSNAAVIDDFYVHLVDAVPDLVEHIHKTTARSLLHLNGYVDRIATAKWDVKQLGMEHNGYVDLLLGEFKHYKTRLAHAEIRKEIQDLLIQYGIENVAEVLVEGLSRVKRCTDEGRALMSLDLQVLINGLKHFVSVDIRPKLHIVETFIKAYYLPETEYVHFARSHPEYTKSQIIGLVNLVATMKGWKRKTRLEVLEKLE
ncbi:hypothetical protein Leryth_002801 [Lithospermum erythrorhizon]|nr:hypothetical protein Leryth_002801 [Lithospermum erythrorhizon]